MNAAQKLIARRMMKLRILEAKATEYQRLFERVMSYAFPEFTPIKPYGRIGDRKNDGYIHSQGLFFQVYAPEKPEADSSAVSAASKAACDFEGLKKGWSQNTPVREFRFAYNDEYRGSPPPLEEALAKIRSQHKIEARTFLAKDLEDVALGLADDQLFDVIGAVVLEDQYFEAVDFGVLAEVVKHVHSQQVAVSADGVLTAPDFKEKIQFNGLSSPVASLLTVGSFQSEAVADFFSMNSEFARQSLRNQLSGLYERSRTRFSDRASDEVGDLVFFDLLKLMTPAGPGAAPQQAAIVVMAFYFEACDVFEAPNAPA